MCNVQFVQIEFSYDAFCMLVDMYRNSKLIQLFEAVRQFGFWILTQNNINRAFT